MAAGPGHARHAGRLGNESTGRWGTKAGRPAVWSRRQLINGIRFRVRTGVPWRDVPVETGRGAGSTTVPPVAAGWHRHGVLTRLPAPSR
ncbi:transposase [Streptomyces puniciscabiei]|uniref:transposase n=1 Tax=Streptomyces puniciscabiei TaxID=164348 RepID=UPI003327AC39